MLEAYKRQHYHEILHYRCFRVETLQHRVLENNLNMGIYYQRIKFIMKWLKHQSRQAMKYDAREK
jgi:hypothetical protein